MHVHRQSADRCKMHLMRDRDIEREKKKENQLRVLNCACSVLMSVKQAQDLYNTTRMKLIGLDDQNTLSYIFLSLSWCLSLYDVRL